MLNGTNPMNGNQLNNNSMTPIDGYLLKTMNGKNNPFMDNYINLIKDNHHVKMCNPMNGNQLNNKSCRCMKSSDGSLLHKPRMRRTL